MISTGGAASGKVFETFRFSQILENSVFVSCQTLQLQSGKWKELTRKARLGLNLLNFIKILRSIKTVL